MENTEYEASLHFQGRGKRAMLTVHAALTRAARFITTPFRWLSDNLGPTSCFTQTEDKKENEVK